MCLIRRGGWIRWGWSPSQKIAQRCRGQKRIFTLVRAGHLQHFQRLDIAIWIPVMPGRLLAPARLHLAILDSTSFDLAGKLETLIRYITKPVIRIRGATLD